MAVWPNFPQFCYCGMELFKSFFPLPRFPPLLLFRPRRCYFATGSIDFAPNFFALGFVLVSYQHFQKQDF